MNTKVCKACGIEKLAVKGIWVTTKGVALGRLCLKCKAAVSLAYHKANPEVRKQWRASNREVCNASSRKWQKTNPEAHNARSKAYKRHKYATNQAYRAAQNAKGLLWSKVNAELVSAFSAKRRARKLCATPAWLTSEDHLQIASMYELAKIMEACTGEKYHVDHIIPLQGTSVSGLHTPLNLQVITASANTSKGNSHEL